MSLSIYNTLTNTKEKFEPIEAGKVKFYLCGPTVYGPLHIGNFRGPIFFNLVRNWLEHIGYQVNFVYNYTDVDDKIIKRAQDEGVEAKEISEKYIQYFQEDFKRLGLRAHDHNPKVTEHMDEIFDIIQKLLDEGKAYSVDGEVFYEISKFADYGKLSKNKLEDLNAGQRVEVDERKRNPLDFVLWKPAKEGEPYWDSPWGKGRPGWHIECSAMIRALLGESIDIHGGGVDLIFPHHECEIAQGEGANKAPYCKYWMHNNFINMNNEKMSKSLGNIISAREFMDQYHPEVLKFIFLNAHYRSILSIDDEKIMQALSALGRVYSALKLCDDTIAEVDQEGVLDESFSSRLDELDESITNALNEDFNTSEYIAAVFEAVRAYNGQGHSTKKKNAVHRKSSELLKRWISKYAKLSALFNEPPAQMLSVIDDIALRLKGISRWEVEDLVKQRNQARQNKDWGRSDELRDELAQMCVELLDGQTPSWRMKV